MSGERILITGAGGFVGGHLTRAIAATKSDWDIFRVDAVGGPPCDANVDVTDARAMASIVTDFRPTKAVHLAAITTVRATVEDPRRAWDVNLNGTLNLALPMQEHCPNAQILLVSSAEVYGVRNDDVAVDESFPVIPNSPYAASKASAELLVLQMGYSGMVGTVARPFTHAGPAQSVRFALSSFASQIVAIERGQADPVLRVGSLEDYRDITDVRDIVDAYMRMLEAGERVNGAIFNLASGRSHRMADVLDLMLSQARVPIRVETDPARLRPMGPTRTLGNARRAEQELGWRARIPLEETLHDILDYWRGQGGD